MENEEEILEKHDVRLTSMRIYVYKVMETFENTFSLADLEDRLESVDKSTIFRVIRTFCEHHLIHEIEDGSGSKKYCVCHNDHVCHLDELHCHFYCTVCKKTFCLTEAAIPSVACPEGFIPQSAEYIIQGICPDCARK